MTTLIVDIEKPEDLEAVTRFLIQNDINYHIISNDENHNILNEESVAYQKADLIEDDEDFIYTDEIKRQLDEDEEAYQRGELVPISSAESKRRITELLNKLRAQNAV